MSNIILPKVQILDTISDEAKILIEQDGEINRFAVTNLGGGDISINLEDTIYGDANPINADTLNGYTAKELFRPKAGFIYPLAGSVIPEGFLLCDGAEYGRTEFPELFAAIGTIYGEGDGSTTFNVPNLQARVPIGAGNGYGLGAVGGEATHTLTVEEMPKHKHWYNNYQQGYPTNFTNAEQYRTPVTKMADSREETTNYSNTDSNYTGGSQPHNNMQPYTVVNYIIATGKDTGVSVSDIVLGAQAIPLGVEYGGTGSTNAADARQNLGITPENIGALSMELLWENASPTSDFVAQTINLNLNEYRFVMVLAGTYDATVLAPSAVTPIGKNGYASWANGSLTRVRQFNVTATGIQFMEGYADGAAKNNACKPLAIYGIK